MGYDYVGISGGFQGNLQLLSHNLQKNLKRICQRNAKTGNSGVFTIAPELGAATTNMDTLNGQALSHDALFTTNLQRYLHPDMLCGDEIVVLVTVVDLPMKATEE